MEGTMPAPSFLWLLRGFYSHIYLWSPVIRSVSRGLRVYSILPHACAHLPVQSPLLLLTDLTCDVYRALLMKVRMMGKTLGHRSHCKMHAYKWTLVIPAVKFTLATLPQTVLQCGTCVDLPVSYQGLTPSPSHLPCHLFLSHFSHSHIAPARNSELFSYRMQNKALSNLHSKT